MNWTAEDLKARIADNNKHIRYAAGSPNAEELKVYASAVPSPCDKAIVLGMTPELRNLIAPLVEHFYAIDINQQSIDMYKDWLVQEFQTKETIINADWLSLNEKITEPVDCILGDGICGNLQDIQAHAVFLKKMHKMLKPEGKLIFRHAMMLEKQQREHHRAEYILEQYRAGQIDANELGSSLRLMAFTDTCFNEQNYILDNQKVFDTIDEMHTQGFIKEDEKQAVYRFLFKGKNCLLPKQQWEMLLAQEGFSFQAVFCTGKTWYEYYPVYICSKL